MDEAVAGSGSIVKSDALGRPHLSYIMGVPVGVLKMAEAIETVNGWIRAGDRAHLITFSNAHMMVEAQLHPPFRSLLNQMDLNCPDGAPIYWILRRRVGPRISKISGPDFMPLFCEQSVALGHRHFIFGGGPNVAQSAAEELVRRYPGIQIAGYYSPPFRSLTEDETEDVADIINRSHAHVVWVCLGCPKQEQWMADMRHRLNAKVLLAVGQAVDILAGTAQRAPHLLRVSGAEWAYRLVKEPRRLWKRYLVTNLLFLLMLLRHWVSVRSANWTQGRSPDDRKHPRPQAPR